MHEVALSCGSHPSRVTICSSGIRAALVLGLAFLTTNGTQVGMAQSIGTIAAQDQKERIEYLLAPGDRVLITVFDQPDLSGDFVIDANGAIMLPLAGGVTAEGATIEELQRRVLSRLADGYLQAPVVSVRVGELRPIYVVGEVNAPGSYPFRYAVTVLSAVALAGGLKVTPNEQSVLRNEYLAADERVQVLEVNYQAMIARRIRLVSQRDDLGTVDFTDVAAASDSPHLKELIVGEREIFTSQVLAHEQEIELLREEVPRLEAEAEALDEQAQQEENQIALLQSQIDDNQKLLGNGLARRSTIVDLQREQAKSRVNLARYHADAARARLMVGDVASRIQASRDSYKRRVMTELQETYMKLMELEASLPTAREGRDMKFRQAGAATGRDVNPYGAILISRFAGGQLVTIKAEDTTVLEPGDIVQVGRQLEGDTKAEPLDTKPEARVADGGGADVRSQ